MNINEYITNSKPNMLIGTNGIGNSDGISSVDFYHRFAVCPPEEIQRQNVAARLLGWERADLPTFLGSSNWELNGISEDSVKDRNRVISETVRKLLKWFDDIAIEHNLISSNYTPTHINIKPNGKFDWYVHNGIERVSYDPSIEDSLTGYPWNDTEFWIQIRGAIRYISDNMNQISPHDYGDYIYTNDLLQNSMEVGTFGSIPTSYISNFSPFGYAGFFGKLSSYWTGEQLFIADKLYEANLWYYPTNPPIPLYYDESVYTYQTKQIGITGQLHPKEFLQYFPPYGLCEDKYLFSFGVYRECNASMSCMQSVSWNEHTIEDFIGYYDFSEFGINTEISGTYIYDYLNWGEIDYDKPIFQSINIFSATPLFYSTDVTRFIYPETWVLDPIQTITFFIKGNTHPSYYYGSENYIIHEGLRCGSPTPQDTNTGIPCTPPYTYVYNPTTCSRYFVTSMVDWNSLEFVDDPRDYNNNIFSTYNLNERYNGSLITRLDLTENYPMWVVDGVAFGSELTTINPNHPVSCNVWEAIRNNTDYDMWFYNPIDGINELYLYWPISLDEDISIYDQSQPYSGNSPIYKQQQKLNEYNSSIFMSSYPTLFFTGEYNLIIGAGGYYLDGLTPPYNIPYGYYYHADWGLDNRVSDYGYIPLFSDVLYPYISALFETLKDDKTSVHIPYINGMGNQYNTYTGVETLMCNNTLGNFPTPSKTSVNHQTFGKVISTSINVTGPSLVINSESAKYHKFSALGWNNVGLGMTTTTEHTHELNNIYTFWKYAPTKDECRNTNNIYTDGQVFAIEDLKNRMKDKLSQAYNSSQIFLSSSKDNDVNIPVHRQYQYGCSLNYNTYATLRNISAYSLPDSSGVLTHLHDDRVVSFSMSGVFSSKMRIHMVYTNKSSLSNIGYNYDIISSTLIWGKKYDVGTRNYAWKPQTDKAYINHEVKFTSPILEGHYHVDYGWVKADTYGELEDVYSFRKGVLVDKILNKIQDGDTNTLIHEASNGWLVNYQSSDISTPPYVNLYTDISNMIKELPTVDENAVFFMAEYIYPLNHEFDTPIFNWTLDSQGNNTSIVESHPRGCFAGINNNLQSISSNLISSGQNIFGQTTYDWTQYSIVGTNNDSSSQSNTVLSRKYNNTGIFSNVKSNWNRTWYGIDNANPIDFNAVLFNNVSGIIPSHS